MSGFYVMTWNKKGESDGKQMPIEFWIILSIMLLVAISIFYVYNTIIKNTPF